MSTNNNIERFIQPNRRDFDSELPSPELWAKLEQQLPVVKKARLFSRTELIRWSAAAAIIVAALTSVYFLYIKNSYEKQTPASQDQLTTSPRQQLDETSGISPEYAVQLQKVSASVESRQQALKAATAHLPELYKQFEKDLEVLDSSFQSLKNQVTQTPNRDVLIKAMIQNLQLQSELLERQLQVIQEFNNNTQTPGNEKTI